VLRALFVKSDLSNNAATEGFKNGIDASLDVLARLD
jgi:hypothetical protein